MYYYIKEDGIHKAIKKKKKIWEEEEEIKGHVNLGGFFFLGKEKLKSLNHNLLMSI